MEVSRAIVSGGNKASLGSTPRTEAAGESGRGCFEKSEARWPKMWHDESGAVGDTRRKGPLRCHGWSGSDPLDPVAQVSPGDVPRAGDWCAEGRFALTSIGASWRRAYSTAGQVGFSTNKAKRKCHESSSRSTREKLGGGGTRTGLRSSFKLKLFTNFYIFTVSFTHSEITIIKIP